jgi:hypothetical protein
MLRRWPLAVLLGVVVAFPAGAAWAQVGTTPSTETPTTPVVTTPKPTVAPTTTSGFRPTTSTVPFRPSSTTAPFRPSTTTVPFRPSTTFPQTTAAPTTTAPTTTEDLTTTTTAPATTTTTAPPATEPASATGRLPFVVIGLLLVGAAIAVMTFLFWRHTRPLYDDFDDDTGAAPLTKLDVVDQGLGTSAYPPDGEPTVVVKPKAPVPDGGLPAGGDGTAVGPDLPTRAADGAGAGVGLGLAGAAGAAALGGAAIAARHASDGDDGAAGPPAVGDDVMVDDDDVEVEAFQASERSAPVRPVAPAAMPAYDPQFDEPEVESTSYDDGYDDLDRYEQLAGVDELDGVDDGDDHELFTGDHQLFDDDDQFADEADDGFADLEPALEPAAPSAVTILGPMRPGKTGGDAVDLTEGGVTVDPDPLEIVTLEDIERARATRDGRPSRRGNGSDRGG